MRKETKKRIVLYATALVLVAGLAYGGFLYRAEPDVGMLVSSAKFLADNGLHDQAIENAGRALRQDPDCRYAHIILAYCYGEKEEYEASLRHYDRAIELSGDDREGRTTLRIYRAEMLLRAGRLREAEAASRAESTEHPEDPRADAVLGYALMRQDRFEEAEEILLRAVRLAPEDPASLLHLSELYEVWGRTEEALCLLDRAADLAKRDASIPLRKARILVEEGDRRGAARAVAAAAERSLGATRRAVMEDEALRTLRDEEPVAELFRTTPSSSRTQPEKRR